MKVKVYIIHGKNIRRWRNSKESTLSLLNQFINSAFKLTTFWLQYEDIDGNLLTLSTQTDFEYAFYCAQKSLKIYVILGSINSNKKIDSLLTPYTFCFVSLLFGDLGHFIPLWVELFYKTAKVELIRKIFDYGLGYLYNCSTFASSLQSKMLNILPSNMKFHVKYNCNINKKTKNKKFIKAHEFIQIRQQIFKFSKKQLIKYLHDLSQISEPNLLSSIFRFGFDRYKQQIPSYLIQSIIKDLCKNKHISPCFVTQQRDNIYEHIIVYGYCRHFSNIPYEILELCYYFYFMLYCANNHDEIHNLFGNKFSKTYIITMDWNNIENAVNESWNKYKTNAMLSIDNHNNSVCRIHERTNNDARYDAFGTQIIGFGQKKIWKIKVSPCIGNFNIGISEVEDTLQKEFKYPEFAYYGFSLVLWNGKIYYSNQARGGLRSKVVSLAHTLDAWDDKHCIVSMELDMTADNCTLRFTVDDYDWGSVADGKIDKTKFYRLAVSFLEPQTAQILQSVEHCSSKKLKRTGNYTLTTEQHALAAMRVKNLISSFEKFKQKRKETLVHMLQKKTVDVVVPLIFVPRLRIVIEDIYMEHYNNNYCAYILLKGATSHKNILYCGNTNSYNDYLAASYLISSILCPRYELRAGCIYGGSCRWLHLNRKTGQYLPTTYGDSLSCSFDIEFNQTEITRCQRACACDNWKKPIKDVGIDLGISIREELLPENYTLDQYFDYFQINVQGMLWRVNTVNTGLTLGEGKQKIRKVHHRYSQCLGVTRSWYKKSHKIRNINHRKTNYTLRRW